MLYYYALKNLYPDWSFYMSIYYINDGGVFDIVFDDDDYIKAENILKKKFNQIRNTKLPKQLSADQSHWKCKSLCAFSQLNENGESICNAMHNQIKNAGILKTTEEHVNMKKLGTYGDGGGRISET